MYSNDSLRPLRDSPLSDVGTNSSHSTSDENESSTQKKNEKYIKPSINQSILDDTILACKNLGFQSEHIIPLAQKILKENQIKKTEQLIHLVLKEV